MKDYVERETLIKEGWHLERQVYGNGYAAIEIKQLKDVPAADVKPVRHGRWKEWWPGDCALIMTGEEMLWMCSECTAKFSDRSSYCPNCGADMRGERDGEV